MRKLLFIFLALQLCPSVPARGEAVAVSAAVSLREVMLDLAKAYEAKSADRIDLGFGASGPLAAQIQAGAPVDLFISAANKQVDELINAGRAEGKTRRTVACNSLVLIVPANAEHPPKNFMELAGPNVKKVAAGQPKTVPAGMYAMQTLGAMKLSEAVSDRLIYAASVRQVLDYVQRSEVDAGIVYATDAVQAGETIKMVATAEESTHEPIEYPAVLISSCAHRAAAEKFLVFLLSDQARAIFSARGFLLPARTPSTRPAP